MRTNRSLSSVFCFLVLMPFALRAETAPAPSSEWIRAIDQGVRQNNGKIPLDPLLSVAVDPLGPGTNFAAPANEQERLYAEAFLKMRSLSTQFLYATLEGRAAYLKVLNPDFLKRVAKDLEFANPGKRANLQDRVFSPNDFPMLLEYIHHNMTFVLNREPDFTKNYMAFGPEDDVHFYRSGQGTNNLFKFANGVTNGQTVRVNFSEKLAQLSLLTTWLIEGNPALGIPALGMNHPVVRGLYIMQVGSMEHDSLHGLQYFFKPVPYLTQIAEQHPETMDPKSPSYGLFDLASIDLTESKLFYEMEGFYTSRYFYRGHEKDIKTAANFLEDLRANKSTIRGVQGAEAWAPNLAPMFSKDGLLQWLQTGTNRRDMVDVYMRGDASNPERNQWEMNDATVYPDSMRDYMFGQFEPARLVTQLHLLNDKVEQDIQHGKPVSEEDRCNYQRIQNAWHTLLEHLRSTDGLEPLKKEFSYLQSVVDRYEGNAALGVVGEVNRIPVLF